MSVVALIGKGPSRDAYWFGEDVTVLVVNGRPDDLIRGDGPHYLATTPEHFAAMRACGGWLSVLCDVDTHGHPIKGHTAPRILRKLLRDPGVTRIYLQGFDLDRPECLSQIREFAKIARGLRPALDRVIVTTPGPLAKFFTCRAPYPEHRGVTR